MTLVFMYGPPAVGKLTVANALAKLTGYRVFHNHLTVDLVASIFDWGQGPFFRFVNRYRVELIEAAAKADINGVIFTFVYAKDADDRFVAAVVDAVERHGGRVCFVRLTCERNELWRRVRAPSRAHFRKVTRVKKLRELFGRYDISSDVSHRPNLVIDNTRVGPRKAAQMIALHYKLPRRPRRPARKRR
ncbi:MAG: AAA family ATPase [bacterium]